MAPSSAFSKLPLLNRSWSRLLWILVCLIPFLETLCVRPAAALNVSGTISTNTVWGASSSPVIIVGNVAVSLTLANFCWRNPLLM